MEETVYCIQINGEKKNYLKGTSYQEIAEEYQSRYKDDILLVLFNNRLRELRKTVKGDGTLVFVTARDKAGRKAYRRSVTFLMQRAVHNLAKDEGKQVTVKVAHSISQGYYCQLKGDIPDREYLARLKAEMMRMAEENIPIQKKSISTDDAVELFRNAGMHDKERLFSYRRSSKVNIYSIGHYIDYFYGYMAPSTGYLKYFELLPYEDGFVVMFPHKNTRVPAEFSPSHKLFHVLRESAEWGEKMEIGTIGALNDAVAQGRIRDVILVAEALM